MADAAFGDLSRGRSDVVGSVTASRGVPARSHRRWMNRRQHSHRNAANSTPPIVVRISTSSTPAAERSLPGTYLGPPQTGWNGTLASNRAYRNHEIIRASP